jgi:hypothetical protein
VSLEAAGDRKEALIGTWLCRPFDLCEGKMIHIAQGLERPHRWKDPIWMERESEILEDQVCSDMQFLELRRDHCKDLVMVANTPGSVVRYQRLSCARARTNEQQLDNWNKFSFHDRPMKAVLFLSLWT